VHPPAPRRSFRFQGHLHPSDLTKALLNHLPRHPCFHRLAASQASQQRERWRYSATNLATARSALFVYGPSSTYRFCSSAVPVASKAPLGGRGWTSRPTSGTLAPVRSTAHVSASAYVSSTWRHRGRFFYFSEFLKRVDSYLNTWISPSTLLLHQLPRIRSLANSPA